MTCIHVLQLCVLQLCEPVHPVIGFNSLFTFTYLPFTFTIVQSYIVLATVPVLLLRTCTAALRTVIKVQHTYITRHIHT
jgi:hypothetical protein